MAFASVGNGLFLVTGKGNDAILVSAGDNVIDAGAGSNFIKSGSGNDIIFENLGSSSVWDTIINFHPGDAVGIWGFVPASSTMTWAPTVLGTSGYEGLTLLITNKGIHDELTFTGASAADIRSLAITTGVSSGQSYLEIRHL
jgi:Ca2+-binding RTX toxin-like protein